MILQNWLNMWRNCNSRELDRSASSGWAARFGLPTGRPVRRRRNRSGRIEPLEDRCLLAAFLVNTIVDEDSGTADPNYGAGTSLREAINAANGNGEADTITFDAAGVFATPQTITLTLGELPITDAVTITGTGAANLTISGNNASRIFNIDNGDSGTVIDVEIVALTLTGGVTYGGGGGILNGENLTMADAVITGNAAYYYSVGGGIYNSGTATLTNCTVSGNFGYSGGGGIYNAGSVTLFNCTLSGNSGGNGGGIFNDSGSMTLTNCRLFDNSAGSGGGIRNSGAATLTNCRLHDNSAYYEGGGIANLGSVTLTDCALSGNTTSGEGGGISSSGSATLTNCTLFDNSATYNGGGIFMNGGSTKLTNCTLSGNTASYAGGGIFVAAGLEMNNTIVAKSLAGDVFNYSGSVTGSHNLVEDGSGGLSDTITGDPKFGPLGNNGGPTETLPLLPGSPAINAGSDDLAVDENGDPLTTDQRGSGFARFINTVDIGAFEFQPSGAQLITDPCDATKMALLVGGTSGNDLIEIKPVKKSINLQVLINNVSYGYFNPTGSLIVSGQAGDDTITVDSTNSRKSFLYGNGGNDSITSGSGPSILVGGDGNDTLNSGNARDILFGGNGADVLNGGNGDDIVIGGSTRFDEMNTSDQQALCAIQNEWMRTAKTDRYTSRVNHLRGTTSGGLNAAFLLTGAPGPSQTVFDDASSDQLTGSSDKDWYFANTVGGTAIDQVFGKLSTELLEEV